MNLKDFFQDEKKRVFEPDAFFIQRMMARLDKGFAREHGIWEIMPNSIRPVLAVGLALILCFVAIELFIPQMPQRGFVESFLEPDESPAESFLYSDGMEIPARQVVLQQLITSEDPQ